MPTITIIYFQPPFRTIRPLSLEVPQNVFVAFQELTSCGCRVTAEIGLGIMPGTYVRYTIEDRSRGDFTEVYSKQNVLADPSDVMELILGFNRGEYETWAATFDDMEFSKKENLD